MLRKLGMKKYWLFLLGVACLGGAEWKFVGKKAELVAGLWGFEENKGQARAGILMQQRGPTQSMAIDSRGIQYSPNGVRVEFVGATGNAAVSLSDPLPGIVNVFSGGDPSKWVRGIKQYSRCTVSGVYPGVAMNYVAESERQLLLRLEIGAGVDPGRVVMEIAKASSVVVRLDGSYVTALIREGKPAYYFEYGPPIVMQGGIKRTARWALRGAKQFGIEVDGADSTAMVVDVPIGDLYFHAIPGLRSVRSTNGESFQLANRPDAAWRTAPFPEIGWSGCAPGIGRPTPCLDTMVAKYSSIGALVWASYLEGETNELGSDLLLALDGNPVIAGITSSSGFPVGASAPQNKYGGPPARPSDFVLDGDWFLARLDASNGNLLGSTYFGGPEADGFGSLEIGPDNSLYLIPALFGGRPGRNMPTSNGALLRSCEGEPCHNGYAARFSATLDRLVFATYLPGIVNLAKMGLDGSVYFAGAAEAGFPVTATAFQRTPLGGYDGIVGRLDSAGGRLIFGTYWGTPLPHSILYLAASPDGSVWMNVGSYSECCLPINTLVKLDALGERVLVKKSMNALDLFVDRQQRLHLFTNPVGGVSPGALAAGTCGRGYVVLKGDGSELFSSNLPSVSGEGFVGISQGGRPLFESEQEFYEIDLETEGGAFATCLVDGAAFLIVDHTTPGAIVTVWGRKMGTDKNRTKLYIDGKEAPLLYLSDGQLNAVVPYNIRIGGRTTARLEQDGRVLREWPVYLGASAVTLFRTSGESPWPAAALNEDGTINSAKNPAKRGSIISFFGTGGGVTVPESTAGELTPLELRRLEYTPTFFFGKSGLFDEGVKPEFAGAAPGQVAGANQFNVRVPLEASEVPGFPKGSLPVRVSSSYPYNSQVSVWVEAQP